MLKQKLTIINKLGLHARATAKLVTLVNQYQSEASLEYNDKSANARSMMGIMMLAAAQGSEVTIELQGNDEKECFNAVETLFNNRFDEPE